MLGVFSPGGHSPHADARSFSAPPQQSAPAIYAVEDVCFNALHDPSYVETAAEVTLCNLS